MKNRLLWGGIVVLSLLALAASAPLALSSKPTRQSSTGGSGHAENWQEPNSPALLVAPGVSPTPIPPPSPMLEFTVSAMRARQYPGGSIRFREIFLETDSFTRYYIDYPSDGLTITGVLQVPKQGQGPYPVLILNHGYWPRQTYEAGTDTWEAANYFSSHGYVTISPDYRSWGESDTAESFFHMGLVADVINLVSSLNTLDFVDSNRVGMWGHSMGGGITTKVLTIDPRVKVAILYAPNSSNDADLISLWGPGCYPGRTFRVLPRCNRGEVIPPELPRTLYLDYVEAAQNPAILRLTSPLYFFDDITAPVQVHSGTADDVTPHEWAQTIYRGLQAVNKDVSFFAYEGQGHFFEGADWDVFMLRSIQFYDSILQ